MSELVCADVRQWAAEYDGPPFHALLCDAPYEMSFMGKGWDNSGIAFDSSMWATLAAHLHPGAFLFVMAGTLNDDLISVALRNAGLRKFHRMLGWVTSQGFPKATRINESGSGSENFEGHRYGGQVLKPALESVLIFNKSYKGKPVDSITATGAGALWIDGGRIGIRKENESGWSETGSKESDNRSMSGKNYDREPKDEIGLGRWPPNFYLVHHPDCVQVGSAQIGNGESKLNDDDSITNSAEGYQRPGASMYTNKQKGKLRAYGKETIDVWQCVDGCPVKAIGEQSGEYGRSSMGGGTTRNQQQGGIEFRKTGNDFQSPQYHDEGNVSRFFLSADWNAETWERLETSDPVLYTAKSSRAERDDGLDGMPEQRPHPPGNEWATTSMWNGENGDEDWKKKNPNLPRKNVHSTVKPIALTRWLATLLLPPAAYAPRRLLVPFCGVASEMIGAHLAGWEDVTGIELEQEHVDIGRARLEWWARQMSFNLE